MEDTQNIPQSLKVQWLNSSLKFVKNDNQLTMGYPKMPMAHVEYFYNLIWQRENHIGFGFKTLYAPLWDAMNAFSDKYQFQIYVDHPESDDMGQLIINKIPRSADDDKNKTVVTSQKAPGAVQQNKPHKQEAVRTIPKSTKCEEPIIKTETDKAPSLQPMSQNCKSSTSEVISNASVKCKPKKPTKNQKYFIQMKKIIDSIAPSFFKSVLLKIYQFLEDENNASVTFTDLAPIEAQFVLNFQGIYNRRAVLDIMFSPFCNDLLNKMSALFKEFDKTSKLDICVGKTDVKTSKREVMFLKVPRYTKMSSTEAKTEINTGVIKSNSDADSITYTDEESGLKHTTEKQMIKSAVFTRSNAQTNSAENRYNLKALNNIKNVNSSHKDNIKNTNLKGIDKNLLKTTDNKERDEKCAILNKTIDTDKSKMETDKKISKAIKKDVEKRKVNTESNESIKITVVNNKKGNSNSNIHNNIKKPTKSGIIFEKAAKYTDNASVTDENIDTEIKGASLRFRKNKLFEAMSTPLEIDKAMRMMRLMGWEGGALGLHGEGIVEPIIPAINITRGAGFGHHVSPKPQKKQNKLENRLQLLHAILDLLTKDDVKYELIFNNDLTGKEKRAFTEIVSLVNSQQMFNSSMKGESELCQKIYDKMADETIKLNMDYNSNNKITLKKTINNTDVKQDVSKKSKKENKSKISTTRYQNNLKIIQMPAKKTDFRILILKEVIKFLNDDKNRTLNLCFDNILFPKYRKYLFNVCKSVNKREFLTYKKLSYRKVILDLYDSLTDDYFDLQYGEDFQSFTIEKVDYYPDITKTSSKKKEKNKAINKLNNLKDKSIDSVDDVNTKNKKGILQKEKDAVKEISDEKIKGKENNDNNNSCNTELVDTNKRVNIPTASSKNIKPYTILVKIEQNINVTSICKLIAKKINQEINFLPYLKNHGVQNGFLVYSCYNKKSCLWLNEVLSDTLIDNIIKYTGVNNKFVLRMKINIDMTLKIILSLLETYNPGLISTGWAVLTPYCKGSGDFLIQVNYDSFEYIRNNNFRLHAGFDEIDFVIDTSPIDV